jgi:hypothetical protein
VSCRTALSSAPVEASKTMVQKKPFWEMTTAELREATKKYDREELGLPGKPLTAFDRKLHVQAGLRGRPRIGLGAKKVQISVERGLLQKMDATARKLRLSRSEMIARALQTVLRIAG